MGLKRSLGLAAAGLVGLPVVLLLIAFGLAQTGAGKRQLATLIEWAASSPDLRISVAGIGGFVPSNLSVEHIEISDRDGVWLTANRIRLDWSPLALLGGHLKVEHLRLAEIDVLRQPAPAAQKPGSTDSSGSALPRRIDIADFRVDRLGLGAALAGEAAVWRLNGTARVAGLQDDNWLTLKAERSDGGDGMLDLDGRYDGAGELLNIKLLAHEGAATLNRLSPAVGKQGVDMRVDIAGPLTDLRGTLKIDAGALLQADGNLRAERQGSTTKATLALTGEVGTLGDATWADAVKGSWSLQAGGTIDAATIVVEHSELSAPAGIATASGRIDRRDDTGDLTFTLDAASAGFRTLLPGISWNRLGANGRLAGKLMQPSVTALLTGEAVRIDEVSIGSASASLDASPRQGGELAGSLKATLDGIVLPTGAGRSLTTQATIEAGVTRSSNGTVALSRLTVNSPLLTAEGSGRLEATSDFPSGQVKASAPDLAAFAEALNLKIAGRLDLSLTATSAGNGLAVAADIALAEGSLPGVPAAILAPRVTATLRGGIAPAQAWRVQTLRLESGAGTVEAQGQGKGLAGRGSVQWRLSDLAAIDENLAGKSEGALELDGSLDTMTARARATLADARIGVAEIPRLSLSADGTRAGGEISGTLSVDGEMQKAPIKGGGDFKIGDDGKAEIGKFDLRWASLTIQANDFTIADAATTGELTVKAERLQDINPFLGARLAGSLTASIEAAASDRLKIKAALQSFRLGDSVALDRASIDGEVADPLGQATFSLSATASGSQLAGPLRTLALKASGERAAFTTTIEGTGENLRANAQAKVATSAATATIDLQSLKATYSGQDVALAQPARIAVGDGGATIERFSLRAGSGTVNASGVLRPRDSKLDIQGRNLPLSLLKMFDPTLQIFGAVDFTAALRGAMARPDVDFTLAATDMRLRTIRTAAIPAGALSAKASLRGDAVTIDGKFSAGKENVVTFSGAGPLPSAEGVRDGRLKIDGTLRLAQLTPFLVGNGRLNGTLTTDLTLTAVAGAIGGNGEIRIVDGRYFNYAQGIAIRDIEAQIGVAGDRLEIRKFTARPGGNGTIALTGNMQIDPQFTLPVEMRLVASSARILDRRDLRATVSSDLRLSGSVARGMTLGGTTTVERAELDLDANVKDGPQIVDLDVREINRPGGAPDDKKREPAPPGPQVALAIKLNAPQGVFVRGRGLDVEMGGTLDIGGTLSQPQIVGALQLRRGTFSGTGRRLEFTRGTITFPDPARLDPLIDFTAATRIESGAVEVAISGRPSAPKVRLSSTPPLPQDEIMAQLLFGRSTNTLSPLQLAEIGQSIGSLSGLTGSGGGILDRLRKAFGFDRLGVSRDPNAAAAGSSPLAGSSLELGRYVTPGVYLGAKQGAVAGSSSAVVEIELAPNVKVESEIGADAQGKVGISLEWDY